MFKKVAIAAAIAAMSVGAHAATQLSVGQLYFTGMASESTYGGFSFVTFAALDAGTTIYFTDTGYTSTGFGTAQTPAESYWSWTTATGVAAGTSVAVYGDKTTAGQPWGTATTNAAKLASVGTWSIITTGSSTTAATAGTGQSATADAVKLNFSSSGDTIYAYQASGSSAGTPTLLAAFSTSATTPTQTSTTTDTMALSGLTTSFGAGATGTFANAAQQVSYARATYYSGTHTGTVAELKTALADTANWTYDTTTLKSVQTVTSNFTVTAVPEPSTYAMLLAGLGMMGVIARRRSRA